VGYHDTNSGHWIDCQARKERYPLIMMAYHLYACVLCVGLTPSQIGVLLRDQYGIPQVRFLTGRKILRVLKKNGISMSVVNRTNCLQ
jgi:hypothetical protein